MADVYGPGNVGVVHFDAHADASEQLMGHLHSHGTPIRRLIDDEHVPGRNFVQVGLRGYYPDRLTLDWMAEQGMRSHFMAEVVEVCPAHDPGYTTALNAHRAIMEMITGMAMRKQGIGGRHHLDVRARGNRSG